MADRIIQFSSIKELLRVLFQGSSLLLTWAVVKRDTVASIDNKNKTYNLTLVKHNFTTDIVNATLLLVSKLKN